MPDVTRLDGNVGQPDLLGIDAVGHSGPPRPSNPIVAAARKRQTEEYSLVACRKFRGVLVQAGEECREMSRGVA